MANSSFVKELERRNVIRVALAYLAGSWLLIQIADTVLPRLGFTDRAVINVIVVLAIGFLPALLLSWIFQWTTQGIKRDSAASTPSSRAATRLFDRAIIMTLVLAVGYFAIDKFVLDPARDRQLVDDARIEGRADAFINAYGENSIAVLPFVNLSADPEQQYFADGISEELLNLLAQIDELRVISRSTAFSFKGQPIVVPEVARKLNVSYVMEGSVRQAGNRVRIMAQLIDARTDTHLWSEVYDRDLDDVFAVQDEIAQHVVEELKLELLVKAPKAEDVDARAHDLYLRARYLLETGNSREDELEAIGLLESALRIAPEWLRANEQLLRIYMRFAFDSDKDDAALYRARSWEMLEKMIAIDPLHSITLNWIGWLEWHLRGDPRGAAPYFEQALQADPRNVTLLHGVARYLSFLDRYEEAVAVGEYLLLNDPACATCVTGLAFDLRQSGRAKEAAERLEAMRAWYPGNTSIEWSVGSAWILAGEPQKALDIFQEHDVPASQNLGLLLALHDLGREEEFEAAFADYRDSGSEHAESIARIYAWIGEADEAFRWLEIMVEREGPEFAELARTDFYHKLHSDPRWTVFLQANGQSEEDLGRIAFDPSYPPEIEEMLRRSESRQVP